jgi:DNA polymerase-4
VSTEKGAAGGAAARSIIHLDMDAFFAAVEVLDNPSLRGKPVIVGGTPEGRGVVSTASYEARIFGVRSAMPAATAVKLCPHGIFLRPRMGRYADVSRRIFAILEEYSPLVEPLSIDEAFIDATGCRPQRAAASRAYACGPAEAIARELQERVAAETGLSCSLGVAANKFLAKLASDLEKPRGLVVVPEAGVEEFLAPLGIERLWGVGPRTAEHLRSLGLARIGDLQRTPERDLERFLGRELGQHLGRLCRGIDERPVVAEGRARSISQETTFAEFIPARDQERLERELFALAEAVAARLRQAGLWGRTLKLKVRDQRFTTLLRARTLESPTCLVDEIFPAALELFQKRVDLGGRSVRLLGVGMTGLTAEPCRQLDLLEPPAWKRAAGAAAAMDAVNEKLGAGAVTLGRLVEPPRKRRSGGRR